MQSAFTVWRTETNERWQLCTYNRWQVKCCAEPFNNIGQLSFSPKGSASAARFSSRDLFPFTGAVIIRKKHFCRLAQKDTKADRPYLFQNLLLTPHVPRIYRFTSASTTPIKDMDTHNNVSAWAQTKQPNWATDSCIRERWVVQPGSGPVGSSPG